MARAGVLLQRATVPLHPKISPVLMVETVGGSKNVNDNSTGVLKDVLHKHCRVEFTRMLSDLSCLLAIDFSKQLFRHVARHLFIV